MPEEELKKDYTDNVNNKPESEKQVDRFSQTTKLLDKELNDKKENILKVLEQGNLREIFEDLLSSENGELCIMSLLECGNNEEEIKNIILANLPEGYAYNLSTNDVIKPEIKEVEDYTGAMITDKKGEEAVQDEEEAVQDEEEAVQDEEEAVQDEEEAVQKKEEAVQDEEEAVQDEEEAVESQERQKEYEIMRKVIGKRTELIKKYRTQNLDGKTNEDSDNYKTIKEQLENNGVLNQLRQTNHDDNFINDYILVQTTLQELKLNPTIYEQDDISYFDKVIKNLNNACNIPDTNLSSFSKENIGDTRKEMFNTDVGNNALIKARDSNKSSHSAEYGELFKDEDMMDTIKKYGKFFPEGAKKYLEKYGEYYKAGRAGEYENSEEGKKLKETLSNVKQSVDDYTENFIEEMCLISQIKGMSMCVGQESGQDFNLNKANEIENNDGVLTLKGHIDGVDFSVRQDTNDPEARLQTCSKLASLNKDELKVSEEGVFTNSSFILPNQKEIFDLVTQRVSESMEPGGILDKAGNRDEFLALMDGTLQSDIIGDMDNLYKDTELVHHYMKNKVKGEKIVDDTLGLINEINPSVRNNKILLENINQTTNNDLFIFMKTLKFNIDNSTDAEKDNLRWCIKEIGKIINNYKTNKKSSGLYSDTISTCLENGKWLGGEGTEDERLGLIFDLFSYFNKNSNENSRVSLEGNIQSKMIINDLYVQLHDKPKQKQKEQQEQEDKEKETDIVYTNLMAAYDQDDSIT